MAMLAEPLWRETPLVESKELSKSAGCRIFLKLDNLQPSGSFKSRGIGNCLKNYLRSHSHTNPNPHFYSSSGGNAGLACVVAAARLGHPATVVVPLTTKPMMMEKIRQSGARDVIQHGKSWREADEYLREVILKTDRSGVYVPPFDHIDIWEGNATIVDEIIAQLEGKAGRKVNGATNGVNGLANGNGVAHQVRPSAIVCSVGGGGLFCGIMHGLSDLPGGEKVQVVAVETTGAASLHQSLASRDLVTLPGITSAATSLGATRVAEETYRVARRSNVHSVTMDDEDAEEGCLRLAECERIMVELACGVNVAMCKRDRLEKAIGREVSQDDIVVVVVCGGSNVTIDMMAQWQSEANDRKASGKKFGEILVLHGKDFS